MGNVTIAMTILWSFLLLVYYILVLVLLSDGEIKSKKEFRLYLIPFAFGILGVFVKLKRLIQKYKELD